MPDPTPSGYSAALARVREAVAEIERCQLVVDNAPVGIDELTRAEKDAMLAYWALWPQVKILLLTPGPEMTRESAEMNAYRLLAFWGQTGLINTDYKVTELADVFQQVAESAALSERLKWAGKVGELERQLDRITDGTWRL
jgi:hypothetical protein